MSALAKNQRQKLLRNPGEAMTENPYKSPEAEVPKKTPNGGIHWLINRENFTNWAKDRMRLLLTAIAVLLFIMWLLRPHVE